jgi:hypothetical protein
MSPWMFRRNGEKDFGLRFYLCGDAYQSSVLETTALLLSRLTFLFNIIIKQVV